MRLKLMELLIRDILGKFLSDKTQIEKLVSSKTLQIWRRALTHESINYLDNYERLEFLGDAAVNFAFIRYLREHLEIKDSDKVTGLLNYYMSKKFQPIMSQKLGLDMYLQIRSEIKVSADILEDIFEAFFGVFEMLYSKLIGDPIPPIINFFIWYFNTYGQIDMSKGDLIDNNFFNEYYQVFANASTETSYGWFYNIKTGAFNYDPKFLNTMKLYSEDLYIEVKKILSRKNMGGPQYYVSGVSKALKKLGFDLEWLTYEKERIKFPNLKDLANRHGYKRFILQRNTYDSYDLLAQSVDPKTKKSISETLEVFRNEDFNAVKDQATDILIRRFSDEDQDE